MYITSKAELKAYIFRLMGSENNRIEISTTNFDDIYNKCLNHMYEYSDDSVNKKTIIVDNNTSKELILDSSVIAINKLIASSSYYNSTTLSYPGISPYYDFLRMGVDNATSTYLVYTESMRDIRNTFRTQIEWSFNAETKTLELGTIEKRFVLDIYESADELLLYEHDYFLKLIERDCWIQWYNNTLGKYIGATIGNGVTINGEYMLSRVEKLDEELKESVDTDEYNFLAPRPIN